jgi:hypothetical protein
MKHGCDDELACIISKNLKYKDLDQKLTEVRPTDIT